MYEVCRAVCANSKVDRINVQGYLALALQGQLVFAG